MFLRIVILCSVVFYLGDVFAKFEPNDISILYPKADIDFNQFYVGLDHPMDNLELLSIKQFEFIERHLNKRQKKLGKFTSYNRWKVVSIRLDPCAAREKSDCASEIRLGVQPYDLKEFKNSALHLVYEVSRDQLRSLFEQLIEVKEKYNFSNPEYISVHRGFKSSEKSGFQIDFEKLVFSLIGQHNLYRVGVMVSIPSEWFFAGYRVDRDRGSEELRLIPEQVPHSQHDEIQVFAGKGFSTSPIADSKIEFLPNTEFPNMVGDIMRNKKLVASFNAEKKLKKDQDFGEKELVERNKMIHSQAVEIVSLPEKFDRFNTDCFSCHGASQALKYSKKVHRTHFVDDYPYSQTSWPLQFSAEALPQAMIAFGYVSYGTPRISLSDRVRAETEINLKFIEHWITDFR